MGISIAITLCFVSGIAAMAPHQGNLRAQIVAIVFGFFSAMAWGLSVLGSHIGARLTVVSDARWNSIMNFFAAAFAALAVGFGYPV
jgi:hypothetical protein